MAYRRNINEIAADAAFEQHLAYLAGLKASKAEYAKRAVESRLAATEPGKKLHNWENSWNTVSGRLGSRSNWSDRF